MRMLRKANRDTAKGLRLVSEPYPLYLNKEHAIRNFVAINFIMYVKKSLEGYQMNQYQRKVVLAFLGVVLWMILIFAFSSQQTIQTNELSMNVTEKIIGTKAAIEVQKSDPDNIAVKWNTAIRKSAHFTLFLMLGVLVMNLIQAIMKERYRGLKPYAVAFLICLLYAFSDEFHQMFVPGRNAVLTDVLIDAAGVLVGLGCFRLLLKISEIVKTKV